MWNDLLRITFVSSGNNRLTRSNSFPLCTLTGCTQEKGHDQEDCGQKAGCQESGNRHQEEAGGNRHQEKDCQEDHGQKAGRQEGCHREAVSVGSLLCVYVCLRGK